MSVNNWVVLRRKNVYGDYQVKTVKTYKQAVEVARRMYCRHGVGWGIRIQLYVEEIGEYVEIRRYYMGINDVEDIV